MAKNGHSLKPYVLILLTLWVLTVTTWGAAKLDFPDPFDDIVAFLIAMTKATLVVLFFMHVKEASPLVKLAAAGGFFWLLIFVAIILSDYLARHPITGWV